MMVAFGGDDGHYVVATEGYELSHHGKLASTIESQIGLPLTAVTLGPETGTFFVGGHKPGNKNVPLHSTPFSYISCPITMLNHLLSEDLALGPHLTRVAEALRSAFKLDMAKRPQGFSFGSNHAYAWWTNEQCHYGNLGDDRNNWIRKMKTDNPSKRVAKIFLGHVSAAVLLWNDGVRTVIAYICLRLG